MNSRWLVSTRYNITDHAPVLKATMLMCTKKQGLMTLWRWWKHRIDTPTRFRLTGHANTAAATTINDQSLGLKRGFSRKAYDYVIFLDTGNSTHGEYFKAIWFLAGSEKISIFTIHNIYAIELERTLNTFK